MAGTLRRKATTITQQSARFTALPWVLEIPHLGDEGQEISLQTSTEKMIGDQVQSKEKLLKMEDAQSWHFLAFSGAVPRILMLR